jgi:hypothetical protein
MNYGVFTSLDLEIAQTKYWAICFSCNEDKTIISSRLYKGIDENKTLVAICERDLNKIKTIYAYEGIDNIKYSNDFEGVCNLLGKPFEYNISNLRQIEEIELSEPYTMPTVDENGIENCLKQWRMGTFCNQTHDGILFSMVTNQVEYVFSIQKENCNIYCGATINVPYEGGMFGGNQYFRFRNYSDNTEPYCRFECNLGNSYDVPMVEKMVCESGKCISTSQGLYWPVKRYNSEEIVLSGCGGDEYIYKRNNRKCEYFTCM